MIPKAKELRKSILEISHMGQDGNLQSLFSSVEIMLVLYDHILHVSADCPDDPARDIFILSKGQSNLCLLALLAEKGFIPENELKTFCRFGSRISMQSDRIKLPGVEASAGSLGHGFPIAAGMAWAKQINQNPGRVFVLAGDGEMNEGTMWEAALFAGSKKLNNLTLIVDDNGSIGEMLDMGDLSKKLIAFGFDAVSVDGHDEDALHAALNMPHERPLAVIAKTVRGYGSRTLIEDRSWFHRAPNGEELERLKAEVDAF